MRTFEVLSENEILALAISLEEEDERIFADYAEGLRRDFPASAAIFDGMRDEESDHRRRLIELYRKKLRDHIPLIRRHERQRLRRPQADLADAATPLDHVRSQVSAMEAEIRRFYEKASARTRDAATRQLLDDLIQEERSHEQKADALEEHNLNPETKLSEDAATRKLFLLQIIQPGLAGLMDGSVSTLAPVFAAGARYA